MYNDTAELTCIENGKTLIGEVMDYTPAYMLVVSVDRSVKVTLRYNTGVKKYIGKVGSLEFESTGPKETVGI